ncbi:MAG: zf-HC2 domain-containing protein [Planctomycetes bacterium]|nr:zf-HC2 domain-containing protein [Planctomycetota bacterium]
MSCEGYGLLISKWVDGEAKPEEGQRAEAHIATCGACRKLAEEFRRNAGLLESALGPEPFGQRVAGSVFDRISRREAFVRWGGRLAVAAALLAAFLLVRSDRETERRQVSEQIQAAMRVVERMQESLERERSRRIEIVRVSEPPAVRDDAVKTAGPVEGPRPVPDEVVHHDVQPVNHSPADHDTFARDRVDASADDYETGAVAVAWKMDRAPGAVWFVYRRPEGSEDWGTPLNEVPLIEPKFRDATARGLMTYEYGVVALCFGTPRVADEIARVKTPPDLHVEFKGRGTLDDQTSFMFSVRVRIGDKWSEESFRVRPGDAIGDKRGAVDFSTGAIFREASDSTDLRTRFRRLRAELETPAGRVSIWNGDRATGSRGRLEVDERPR